MNDSVEGAQEQANHMHTLSGLSGLMPEIENL
jgi:hypothetical protein